MYKALFCRSFLLALLFQVLLLPPLQAQDLSSGPKRIALLPVITEAGNGNDIVPYLTEALKKEVHIPLNLTLQAAVYIPAGEIQQAMADLQISEKTLYQKENLERLAAALHADLLTGFQINNAYEYRFYSMTNDTFVLQSFVSLTLFYYDKNKNNLQTFHDQDSFTDEFSLTGTLSALTEKTSDRLLKKASIKNALFPLSQQPARAETP